MKTIYIQIGLFTCLLFSLLSCQKVLDMEVEHRASKLVMYAHLLPDSLVTVAIGASVPILKKDTLKNITAKISIYENDNFIEVLSFVSNGIYRTNSLRPKIGANYTITAEADGYGYEKISGSTKIPIPTEIMKVDTFNELNSDLNGTYMQLIFSTNFNDPNNTENFYSISIKNYDSINQYFNYQPFNVNNPIIELYLGWSDVYHIVDQNNNSFFGSEKDNEILANEILFSDIAINGKSTNIKLKILDQYYNYFDPRIPTIKDTSSTITTMKYEIILKSLTKDFFLYSKSMALYLSTNSDPFSEKVKVYNNITNGYGLISSESNSKWIIER
jgi:hypothetical protein